VKSKPCPRCRDRGGDRSGDNLVAFANGHWHCFNCSYHIFPQGMDRFKHGNESIRTEKSLNLPNDLTKNIPTHALKWLLQYGLPYSYWQPYILWSETDSRLIFKVGEPPEFYQGRYLPVGSGGEVRQGEGLTLHDLSTRERGPRKWYCYGNAHQTAHLFGNPDTSRSIVLVEDLLSAHKVSQVNATIPLFGTNVFDSVVSVLRLYKKPVILWLDKDQNGNIIKKCNKINMLTGLPVNYIFTSDDPKAISLNDIKGLLE
jgi:hypothetical protein